MKNIEDQHYTTENSLFICLQPTCPVSFYFNVLICEKCFWDLKWPWTCEWIWILLCISSKSPSLCCYWTFIENQVAFVKEMETACRKFISYILPIFSSKKDFINSEALAYIYVLYFIMTSVMTLFATQERH